MTKARITADQDAEALHATLAKFVAEVGPEASDVMNAVANLAANVIITTANGDQVVRDEVTAVFARSTAEAVSGIAARIYREARAGRA